MNSSENSEKEMTQQQELFIEALAEYLSHNAAIKSIDLQLGKTSGKEWAKVRAAGPMLSHDNVEETKKKLISFLGFKKL